MTDTPPTDMVLISAARLAELEAAAAKVAKQREKNKEARREYEQTHPEKSVARYTRWYAANREEINARRREKRRLEKEAAAAAEAAADGC